MTRAEVQRVRAKFPRAYELLKRDILLDLQGSHIVELHTGTVVEVRGEGLAIVPKGRLTGASRRG